MVSRPHGGRLVDRVVGSRKREALELPSLELGFDKAVDLEDLAHGVYSPLEGFMVREDYVGVLEDMRLSSDYPWTISIVLDASPGELGGCGGG